MSRYRRRSWTTAIIGLPRGSTTGKDTPAGEVQPLQGENYAISVDVNDTFSDGTPKPNVGRPYVANSYWTGDDSTTTTRDSLRFTATAELRSDDFLPKGIWTDILGRSVFTGLMEEDIKYTDALQWNQYRHDC